MEPQIEEKDLTQEELEALAEQYRGWPNKMGRPPRKYAKEIARINKQKTVVKIEQVKDKKPRIIMSKPDTLEAFIEEFVKNGGNATQAALVTTGATNLQSASTAGYKLLKQAKTLGRIHLEKKGFHYGKMLDVATEKMLETKTPDWWDRLMRISGYDGFEAPKGGQQQQVVNIVQAQKQQANDFGFEEAEIVGSDE